MNRSPAMLYFLEFLRRLHS